MTIPTRPQACIHASELLPYDSGCAVAHLRAALEHPGAINPGLAQHVLQQLHELDLAEGRCVHDPFRAAG